MCGGAAATTSTLARIENILLKPLLLLKYEFSRRLVLTVRIPGVATPAGSSSRRGKPPAIAAAVVAALGGVSGTFVGRGIAD
jgi:hypothetical protein